MSYYRFAADWKIGQYGTSLATFLAGLNDDRAVFEAAALIEVLRRRGNQVREPRSKSLGEGLFELRGKQVRIFYVFRPGFRIVLLDGILKKRDDIPNAKLHYLRKLQREVE